MSIADVKLIIYDFDGVMTNNKALLMDDGREAVFVHRGDGFAVSRIKEKGIPQIILSTETNPIVAARAKKLGIPVFHAVEDKKAALETILKDRKVDRKDVIFVGNDLNDETAMRLVGWPIAPADACSQIKKIAKIVLSTQGGDGVVRELLDLLEKE
jgi:3-deoxy-D-manno-octulosonate 8-phosphate phosphatase (KDO 8-P phosphatase)